MRKATISACLLTAFFFSPAAHAGCAPGPLFSPIYIEFTVKPPRFSESGGCTIDLANPQPTLGDIFAGRDYSICVTDSYLAMIESASLKVKSNCSFTLKSSWGSGGFTANGKLDNDLGHGKGTISIKNGSKRQTGKFELWDTNQYLLSSRTAQLKSRAQELAR